MISFIKYLIEAIHKDVHDIYGLIDPNGTLHERKHEDEIHDDIAYRKARKNLGGVEKDGWTRVEGQHGVLNIEFHHKSDSAATHAADFAHKYGKGRNIVVDKVDDYRRARATDEFAPNKHSEALNFILQKHG